MEENRSMTFPRMLEQREGNRIDQNEEFTFHADNNYTVCIPNFVNQVTTTYAEHNAKIYIYIYTMFYLIHICIHLIKFNLLIRHTKKLTAITDKNVEQL